MFIETNNVKLFYEEKGQGRPLIMVHGNSENHEIFEEASEVLKEHFRVFLIDSRCHGQSEKTQELHYSDMADDMAAFMEKLDLHDVVFYGFSDGGIIGLLLPQRTDRINRMILSGANVTPAGVKKGLRILIKIMYFLTRDKKMKMMMEEPNITEYELQKINVKTTVVVGEKDAVTMEETGIIADNIPGARLLVLPGEGHGSYIVHKTKIADIILNETKE